MATLLMQHFTPTLEEHNQDVALIQLADVLIQELMK